MLTRRWLRVGIGFVSGILVLGGLSLTALAHDGEGPTKSGLRNRGKSAAETGFQRWQGLPAERQEELKQRSTQGLEHGQEHWQELSEEEQQEIREKGYDAGKRLQKRWQKLPE